MVDRPGGMVVVKPCLEAGTVEDVAAGGRFNAAFASNRTRQMQQSTTASPPSAAERDGSKGRKKRED